ncbi:MAG: AMP-binding protein [Actinobacteria bacterium]|uniref:Unannotated protein n=1 Tax=freshwater metagenome TaxID=449393 RepID=A0A6J7D139_9ZZZZ|nr:AMP-binding protein [Actinomycetota bacterium]
MSDLSDRLQGTFAAIATLRSSGLIGLERPDRAIKAAGALKKFGPTPAAAIAAAGVRHPDALAVIDDRGVHTWREISDRADALARALASRGVTAESGVGVMLRDQADFLVSVGAIARIGADLVLLNTSFAAPQVEGVVEREGVSTVIYDLEFDAVVSGVELAGSKVIAWGAADAPGRDSIDSLVATAPSAQPPLPDSPGRTVILTSGTTGTPKGAKRGKPPSILDMASLLDKIPLKSGEVTVIAAPLFHSWGFVHLSVATALGSTMVLRRRFNPAQVVEDINRFDASALVVVPVMLKRILDLPEAERAVASGTLRIIAASGSALSAELGTRAMDQYGPVLHNLYGSTEVAWATIATPEDLLAAPGCAGRPPRGVTVKLVDEEGVEVAEGERGRIFVGNEMLFEGYTGGGGKEVLKGLMSTGDVGRFDEGGRLFVEGRDDDMIVSGGENVFPEEVEDCLNSHEAVKDSAVVGVPDEEFGQRLRAAVVLESGSKATAEDLTAHVKAELARYKVPREIIFLDELPRTATGKILRRRIIEL